MKKIFSRLTSILSVLLFILVFVFFVMRMMGSDISVFGYRLYHVSSGSMEPVYMTGDIILSKQVDLSTLKEGDDISYHSVSGETNGMIISHRLIETPYQDDQGEWHLLTSGIYEGAIADSPIVGDQVIGKIVRDCKVITLVYNVFTSKYGIFIIIIPIGIMMVSEIKNIVKVIKDEGANKDEEVS